MSKEFDELMKAQEAIRLWYQAHPNESPPEWMVEALRRAQEVHDARKAIDREGAKQ